MNILLATGIYPPDIGGPATYTKNLAKRLIALGHQVRVIAYGEPQKDDLEEKGILVYRLSRRQNIFWRYFKYFWRLWQLTGWAEVIYAQGPISEGLPTWLACRLKRKKFILKIVGDYAWEQARQRFGVQELLDDFLAKKYGFKVELMRFCQKRVALAASQIIVPSYYLKTVVEKWGLASAKIKVIYNAVPAPDMPLSRAQAKAKLGLAGDIIISAGRLVPWKGFAELIEVMPELLKVNPNFKLIIIGSGPEKEKLSAQIKSLNLSSAVKILAKMPPAGLYLYLRAADFFVLNSAYEGLPHIVIEAMHLGTPVIASQAGGNREVVKHKQTGWLIPANDKQALKQALFTLWQNPGQAQALARAAQANLAKFSYQTMLNDLLAVFEQNKNNL